MPVTRPIVFLGPSISLEAARRTLPSADFRPPIRRGDLDGIAPSTVVGVIDGLFAQTLAISPGEIREVIGNGVAVYGGASMGALRAAEVPGVIGVGRVYDLYRTGAIERDDEVAVMVHPETHEALTEPLVNVRFAVDRLVRTGTLRREDGAAIVEGAAALHFSDRIYPNILARSRLARNRDVDDIIRLLETFDLKRDDAQLLLETISTAEAPTPRRRRERSPYVPRGDNAHDRARLHEDGAARITVWESGDSVAFSELVRFLKLTGSFEEYARNAIARMALAGRPLGVSGQDTNGDLTAQSLLDTVRIQWGWESPEEAHVTMRDLGLGLDDVADSLDGEVTARELVTAAASGSGEWFAKALRVELWMNELALKREVMRLGALRFFARQGAERGPASDAEIDDARRSMARLRRSMRWPAVVSKLAALGVGETELDRAVRDLALARRAAHPLVAAMDRPAAGWQASSASAADRWGTLGLDLEPSPKAEGTRRFSLRLDVAAASAGSIAKQMKIRRIGLVGELDTLGVYIAQAFGDRSGWSSSFSSGKAETREGARVGSIMEEVEIHAQDAYVPAERIRTSYAAATADLPLVDPLELGLPYDSRYTNSLEIDWSPCLDLIGGRTVLVPTAALVGDRQPNDPLYCRRLGGKIFSSSGLGSGFTLAEGIVHAGAEYIERHAYKLAELEIDNPGGIGVRRFSFIDQATLPETPARIVEKYHRAGACVRIVDITSEVAIPTFFARVYDDPFPGAPSMSSDGFAAHPDPEVAVTMALLEAAQTRGGFIAGGREDYSLQARSLGRHERPRTAVPRSHAFWFSNDRPTKPFQATCGFVTRDILDELVWIVDRVRDAGVQMFLVADYTIDRIRPARAVRVIIPGLEPTNPLFTGPRGRATLIRDLLPLGSDAG